jgi:hypothetical protein
MRTFPPDSSVDVIVGANTGAENVTDELSVDDQPLESVVPPTVTDAIARASTARDADPAWATSHTNLTAPSAVALSEAVAVCHVVPESKLNCAA